MPEDDNLSIILGRPFLNTAGAVIDCTESKVTFNVKGKEHTIYFPKKKVVTMVNQMVNCIKRNTLMVGSFEIPLPPPELKYATCLHQLRNLRIRLRNERSLTHWGICLRSHLSLLRVPQRVEKRHPKLLGRSHHSHPLLSKLTVTHWGIRPPSHNPSLLRGPQRLRGKLLN